MTLLNTATILQEYLPLITSFVLVILWFGRLEMKTKSNSARIAILERKDEEIGKLTVTVERIDARLSVLLPDYNGKK